MSTIFIRSFSAVGNDSSMVWPPEPQQYIEMSGLRKRGVGVGVGVGVGARLGLVLGFLLPAARETADGRRKGMMLLTTSCCRCCCCFTLIISSSIAISISRSSLKSGYLVPGAKVTWVRFNERCRSEDFVGECCLAWGGGVAWAMALAAGSWA